MQMFTVTDSRGQRTTTGALVYLAFFALLGKFAIAGLDLGPLGEMAPMDPATFGTAVMTILAPWIAREWKAKSGQEETGGSD